jgi:hypothetical protein
MFTFILLVLVVFFSNVVVDTARLEGTHSGKFWSVLFKVSKEWAVSYWLALDSKIQSLLNKSI